MVNGSWNVSGSTISELGNTSSGFGKLPLEFNRPEVGFGAIRASDGLNPSSRLITGIPNSKESNFPFSP